MGAKYLRHRSGRLIPVPVPVKENVGGASYFVYRTLLGILPTKRSTNPNTSPRIVSRLEAQRSNEDFGEPTILKNPCGTTAAGDGAGSNNTDSMPLHIAATASISRDVASEGDQAASSSPEIQSISIDTSQLVSALLSAACPAGARSTPFAPSSPGQNDTAGSVANMRSANSCAQSPAEDAASPSLSCFATSATCSETTYHASIATSVTPSGPSAAPSVSSSRSSSAQPVNPAPALPLFEKHSGILSLNLRQTLLTVAPHTLPVQLQLCLKYVYGTSVSASEIVAEAPPPYMSLSCTQGMGVADLAAWCYRVEAAWYRKLRALTQVQATRATWQRGAGARPGGGEAAAAAASCNDGRGWHGVVAGNRSRRSSASTLSYSMSGGGVVPGAVPTAPPPVGFAMLPTQMGAAMVAPFTPSTAPPFMVPGGAMFQPSLPAQVMAGVLQPLGYGVQQQVWGGGYAGQWRCG